MVNIQISELVEALIIVSEKAASVARCIRNHDLFTNIVEEKSSICKNNEVLQDFKTLADVLIQEVIKHDLEKKFSGIAQNIKGEESNSIENAHGERIIVEISDISTETTQLLGRAFGGNEEIAKSLTEIIYNNKAAPKYVEDISIEKDLQNIGIWIDPIDCTSEYIHGNEKASPVEGIYLDGLQCVVVLIGAYDLITGEPIIGVINQPFYKKSVDNWEGKYFWGMAIDNLTKHNISPICPRSANGSTSVVVTSSNEPFIVQEKLAEKFTLMHTKGAGYKCLNVLEDFAAAYVSTMSYTYKWDTCAPHAVLNARSGGILDFKKSLQVYIENKDNNTEDIPLLLKKCQLMYNMDECQLSPSDKSWSNKNGFIAYTNLDVLIEVLEICSNIQF